MYFVLSVFPVFLALLLMTRFRVQPGIALPVSLACTALSGFFAWEMPVLRLLAVALFGVFKSVDIIIILFGAVLLLNILKSNNAMDIINKTFAFISPDRRIQVVIIAWLFSSFIEGAAGFGSAPALIAPLLTGLGFPVVAACSAALIGNTLPVPFGAVGTPMMTLNSVLAADIAGTGVDHKVFEHAVMSVFTDISLLSGVFLPFVMTAFMIICSGRKNKLSAICGIFPFCVIAGIVYFVPWKISAMMFGPELPSMIGAIVALPVMILILKLKVKFVVPEEVWDFEEKSQEQYSSDVFATQSLSRIYPFSEIIRAWTPYMLIALLLVITRMPMLPFKNFLQSIAVVVPPVFGEPGTQMKFAFLYNSGIFPFLFVSAVTMFLYGIKKQNIPELVIFTAKQISQSAVAIAASFAIVQIMVFSDCSSVPGMLNVIASTASGVLGKAYIAAAPVIGVLGTFFAGSCTVSNILFGSIQFNIAHLAMLPEEIVIALQNLGGGLGSMIRISGVVATCATVNAMGQEGRIILLNSVPAAVMVLLGLAAAFFVI